MPFHFEYDSSHRILLVVAQGDFGDADQIGIIDAIRRQASELNPAAGIGDYTLLTSFTASVAAIQSAARQPSPYPASVPRFLVAPSDHVFGVSRMYKAIGEVTRAAVRIVRSRAEALDALGVRDARFERVLANERPSVPC
jgi:hypothetical protein